MKTAIETATREEAIQMFEFGWKDGCSNTKVILAERGTLRAAYLAGYTAGARRVAALPPSLYRHFACSEHPMVKDYEANTHARIWAARNLLDVKEAA